MRKSLIIAAEVAVTAAIVAVLAVAINWLLLGTADVGGVLATVMVSALFFGLFVLPVSWAITRGIVWVARVLSS